MILVGDTEYACREVVRGLPRRIEFVGPMSMDAALFELPPQNAKGRGRPRKKGRRRNKKIPGPQPHEVRGAKAVTRTVPFILTIYALVALWYFGNGSARDDVDRARKRAPWYREKTEPSFGDMLAALRRHLWAERNFSEPSFEQGAIKFDAALLDWLCAA